MFNQSQYPAMIRQGLLTAQMLRDDPLNHPEEKNEPEGTRSQMIRYVDSQGRWVVEVHQYLRRDGTIGGKGKPDPKRLRLEDTIYMVPRQKQTKRKGGEAA